jgi:hypothetical protein
MVLPAVVFDGCIVNASLLAGAALMVKEDEVALVRPEELAVRV